MLGIFRSFRKCLGLSLSVGLKRSQVLLYCSHFTEILSGVGGGGGAAHSEREGRISSMQRTRTRGRYYGRRVQFCAVRRLLSSAWRGEHAGEHAFANSHLLRHSHARTHVHIITQSQPTVQLLTSPTSSTHLLSGSSKCCQCIYIRYYVHLDYDMTG